MSLLFSDVEQYFYLQKCIIGLIFAIVKNIGQASFLCYTNFCRQVEKVPYQEQKLHKLFDPLKDSQVFKDRIENGADKVFRIGGKRDQWTA